MSEPTRREFYIEYNNTAAPFPCAVCGGQADARMDLTLMVRGEKSGDVCFDCGWREAPEMMLAISLFERAYHKEEEGVSWRKPDTDSMKRMAGVLTEAEVEEELRRARRLNEEDPEGYPF